jgi:hypothetical protein
VDFFGFLFWNVYILQPQLPQKLMYYQIYTKNGGETAVIEQDVHKNVLQRAGWALPGPFFVFTVISHNKKITVAMLLPGNTTELHGGARKRVR